MSKANRILSRLQESDTNIKFIRYSKAASTSFLICLDKNGTIYWELTYQGSLTSGNGIFYSIEDDKKHNCEFEHSSDHGKANLRIAYEVDGNTVVKNYKYIDTSGYVGVSL